MKLLPSPSAGVAVGKVRAGHSRVCRVHLGYLNGVCVLTERYRRIIQLCVVIPSGIWEMRAQARSRNHVNLEVLGYTVGEQPPGRQGGPRRRFLWSKINHKSAGREETAFTKKMIASAPLITRFQPSASAGRIKAVGPAGTFHLWSASARSAAEAAGDNSTDDKNLFRRTYRNGYEPVRNDDDFWSLPPFEPKFDSTQKGRARRFWPAESRLAEAAAQTQNTRGRSI